MDLKLCFEELSSEPIEELHIVELNRTWHLGFKRLFHAAIRYLSSICSFGPEEPPFFALKEIIAVCRPYLPRVAFLGRRADQVLPQPWQQIIMEYVVEFVLYHGRADVRLQKYDPNYYQEGRHRQSQGSSWRLAICRARS